MIAIDGDELYKFEERLLFKRRERLAPQVKAHTERCSSLDPNRVDEATNAKLESDEQSHLAVKRAIFARRLGDMPNFRLLLGRS